MRASQADSMVSSCTTPGPQQSPDQQLQSGKFFYQDGSTYEGQFKVLGLTSVAVDAAPPKKGVKKAKEDEAPQQAAEAPKPVVRHGAGRIVCGSYSYTGDWVEDEMHGQGKFTFASGATYQGCFDHNKFHGQGAYTFPDGKQYQGQWVANVMHGEGCFIDTEGHQWTGQFYNGAGPGLTCQL